MSKVFPPSPPWSGVGRRIESQVRKALYDFGMLEGCEHLAVALSGGKDSVTLLLMLRAIAGRGFPPFTLTALHIGGAFSCGAGVEARYLKELCAALEIPLEVRVAHQKLEELECYSCSRRRRSLLFEAAKAVGARHIAFGHHRQDSAETLMLNLLHKGEFAGLLPKVPMHKWGVTILRPLIYAAEEEIRTFAEQCGFARISCRCPVGQRSRRRSVKELLYEIEELFPCARQNLAQAALAYGSDKAALP